MTIHTPTTLILGAGSSFHCGYPLGMQLINSVVNLQLNSSIPSLPGKYDESELETLITRLSRSGHYSIDAFLESVPEYTELGKFLIAVVLKQREELPRLFPPHDSGWYQYLFNALLGSRESAFGGNHLSIITFNYDRSLEAYLHNALVARFGMSTDEAIVELSRIAIIHVHGVLGQYPQVPYQRDVTPDELYAIAQDINIIHEIVDNEGRFCNSAFENANAVITSSVKVVFLGFGFHFDNMRRLGVDWSKINSLYSTFCNLSDAEYDRIIARLSNLGISRHNLPMRGGGDCNSFFRFSATLD